MKIKINISNKLKQTFAVVIAVFLFTAICQTHTAFALTDSNDGESYGEIDYNSYGTEFAVITDLHVPYAAIDGKPEHTKEDGGWKNNSDGTQSELVGQMFNQIKDKGITLSLTVGDYTANSSQSQYDLYKNVLNKYYSGESYDVIEAIGNHELYVSKLADKNEQTRVAEYAKLQQRWRDNMQTPLYYSQYIGSIDVIVMGSDGIYPAGDDWGNCHYSDKQLEWLKTTLDRDLNNGITSIVLTHHPLDSTYPVTKNNTSKYIHGVDKLREIINSHKNAIVFSGHSHMLNTIGDKPRVFQDEASNSLYVHAGSAHSATPTYLTIKQSETNKREFAISFIDYNTNTTNATYVHSWEPDLYIVHFQSDGEDVKDMPEDIQVNRGDTTTIELKTPQREGYVFNGWIDEGEQLHTDNIVLINSAEIGNSYILTASWKLPLGEPFEDVEDEGAIRENIPSQETLENAEPINTNVSNQENAEVDNQNVVNHSFQVASNSISQQPEQTVKSAQTLSATGETTNSTWLWLLVFGVFVVFLRRMRKIAYN